MSLLRIFKNFKIIRFVIIGILNTFFGFTIYSFFIFIGLSYYLAAAISTVLGIIFNFKTMSKFVFQNSNNLLLCRYLLVYLLTYLLGIILIAILVNLGLNYYLAGLGAIILNAIITYFLLNNFVFNKPNKI